MAQTIIVGAGLMGLSTAYHLEQLGCHDYTLLEAEPTVGGLCRSISVDGFTFDYTGHLLHISDDYFRSFIDTHVGIDNFHAIQRRSFIYSHDTYTPYPFQVNLHGLPAEIIAECIQGYVERPRGKKPSRQFTQWVLQQFGAGLARHFFFPYQEKIFDIPVDQLSSSWTGRFVPSTDLASLLKGALAPAQKTAAHGYNAHFLYPRQGGIFYWIDKLARLVTNPIATNHSVSSIDIVNKIVTCTNGQRFAYDRLISTMPLDLLLRMLTGSSRIHMQQAADKLQCNSVINFNIGIARPDVSDKHWIYFPEKQFPFYRLGFTDQFNPASAPAGHSLLYGEISALYKDHASQQKLLARALEATYKLFKLSPQDIALEHIVHIPRAYVIYDAWRDRHIGRIHERLNEFNIHSVGRYGAWKYSSMQEGMLEGKALAHTLIHGA